MNRVLLLGLVSFLAFGPIRLAGVSFKGIDYLLPTDGLTDAQPGLKALFSAVSISTGSNNIVLPPGRYLLGLASSTNNIPLPGNTRIDASAAVFLFPTNLPTSNTDYPFPKAFVGVDVTNLTWIGGSVLGYGFDLSASNPATNLWQPKESPAFLYLSSTANHGCENIGVTAFSATNITGPVVAVNGIGGGTTYSSVTTTTSRNISLSHCNFINCGLFYWDYSYLLQIVCYSNHYSNAQWWMATNYMWPGYNLGGVTTVPGSSLVGFNNPGLVALNTNSSSQAYQCTFYGIPPPSTPQIIAGNPYFVIATNSSGVVVSSSQGGTPILFNASSTNSMGFINSISSAGSAEYIPWGQSRAVHSGAWYFIDCTNVVVTGCTWSSPGDSSGFVRTASILMTDNEVRDVRMGGLFLGDGCRDASISNNFFNFGATGSRPITLETCSNIAVVSNIFIGGGRGFLLVNPQRLTIANNIMRTNCTKGYQDWAIGRIGPESGGTWEHEPVFNIAGNSTNCGGGITITNNQIQTDIAVYMTKFSGGAVGLFTNIIITDNFITGTRLDGSSTVGWRTNYPAIPPLSINTVLYNSVIARNTGLELEADGQYCTTLPTSTNVVTIPHYLPDIWPSSTGTLYTDSGSYLNMSTVATATNYTAAAIPLSPTEPSINSVSMDATNIYVRYSSPLASGTPLSLSWTAKRTLNIGWDPFLEEYIARLFADGVPLTYNDRLYLIVLYNYLINYSSGYKMLEIYPFYGQWPGSLEKLKYAGSEPRLRNLGSLDSRAVPFDSSNYSVRGLTGNAANNGLQTSLSPGPNGGCTVFLNSAAPHAPATGSFFLGVDDGGTNQFGLQWIGTAVKGMWGGNTVSVSVPMSTFYNPLMFSVARYGNTLSLYTNGVLAASKTSTLTSPASVKNICLFGASDLNNNPTNKFDGTIAFAIVDDGRLTPANYATIYNTLTNWFTRIGRLP